MLLCEAQLVVGQVALVFPVLLGASYVMHLKCLNGPEFLKTQNSRSPFWH